MFSGLFRLEDPDFTLESQNIHGIHDTGAVLIIINL
jgi:hypothetical protein